MEPRRRKPEKPYSSVTGKPIGADAVKARNDYLISYNAVSALLWSAVLSHVVGSWYLHGWEHVFNNAAEFTRLVQTVALLEVLHSAAELVKAPIGTTVLQVVSRFFLVWGICVFFPKSTAASPAFISMVLAWSVTEIIRYTYFALNLKDKDKVPDALTWLRYSAFFVLYPVGIVSECWLIFKATPDAAARSWVVECVLWLVLAFYVPGSYILFTHMMAQRAKVMRQMKGRSSL